MPLALGTLNSISTLIALDVIVEWLEVTRIKVCEPRIVAHMGILVTFRRSQIFLQSNTISQMIPMGMATATAIATTANAIAATNVKMPSSNHRGNSQTRGIHNQENPKPHSFRISKVRAATVKAGKLDLMTVLATLMSLMLLISPYPSNFLETCKRKLLE
jgi:hypothetical protein